MLLFEKSNQKDLAVGNRFEGKRYPSIGAAIKDLFYPKKLGKKIYLPYGTKPKGYKQPITSQCTALFRDLRRCT